MRVVEAAGVEVAVVEENSALTLVVAANAVATKLEKRCDPILLTLWIANGIARPNMLVVVLTLVVPRSSPGADSSEGVEFGVLVATGVSNVPSSVEFSVVDEEFVLGVVEALTSSLRGCGTISLPGVDVEASSSMYAEFSLEKLPEGESSSRSSFKELAA